MSFDFPKTHLIAIASICAGLWVFGFSDFKEPSFAKAPSIESTTLPINALPTTESTVAAAGPATDSAVAIQPVSNAQAIEHTVQRGENLAVVFQKHGFSAPELHAMAISRPHGKRLQNILPGKTIRFILDQRGLLSKLSYQPSPLELLEFQRVKNGYSGKLTRKQADVNRVYRTGRINQSLFVSAQRSGLSDALIMQLAKIFQWDIDFALDLRRGDEFSVILEELYVDGRFIGHRDILAAEFLNQGESFRAVRFEPNDSGEGGYYTSNGKSLRKAFLRAPLEFSRISSNFDLRRVHPLFNRLRPHRGIDYAAPTGTPIRASGSGRVQIAGKSAANGNYVVLQHSAEYQTKYLHLSRFAKGLRAGKRVKQGELIGYVGQTGWATGPHLHYEFLVNGAHQNPRTVKLPNDAPISGKQLIAFREYAKPLLFQLDAYRQGPQIAAAN